MGRPAVRRKKPILDVINLLNIYLKRNAENQVSFFVVNEKICIFNLQVIRADMIRLIVKEWYRNPKDWHPSLTSELLNLSSCLERTIIPYQELLAIALLHFAAPWCLKAVLEIYEIPSKEQTTESNVAAMFDALIDCKLPLAPSNYFLTHSDRSKSSDD